MPIGSSSGQYYQDQGDMLVDQYSGPMSAKEKSDRKEIDANTTSGDFQSRFGAIEPPAERIYVSPRRPLGGPTEVTGALESSGGTNVPGNGSTQDYDYDAWKAANPGVEMASGQHYPDTYKLPNHMTFSDESIYHGVNGAQGGHWGQDEQGADTFTPGVTNLQQHSMDEMKDYFHRIEPNAKLLPPDIDTVLKAQETAPVKPNVLFHTKTGVDITDQDIDKGMNLAMAFSGGGLTFAGVKAANMPGKLADLGHAQVLEANGVHPDTVFAKTGFFRGTDSRWRHEIDDSKASFDQEWSDDPKIAALNPQGDVVKPLSEILDHSELFKAYPDMKNMPVVFDKDLEGIAHYDSNADAIHMGLKAVEHKNQQGILMHEVQHAIQEREGFAKGGSYSEVGSAEAVRKAYEYYMRLAGEAEARNTDSRLLLTSSERKSMHPRWTEDLNARDQIVVHEPTLTTAEGAIDPRSGGYIKAPNEPTQFRRAANDNAPLDPLEHTIKGTDFTLMRIQEALDAIEKSKKK